MVKMKNVKDEERRTAATRGGKNGEGREKEGKETEGDKGEERGNGCGDEGRGDS